MDGWELAGHLPANQPPGALRLVAVTAGYGRFDAQLVKHLDLDAILHELEPPGGAGAATPS